ncbi:MAG: hypothetical protein AB7V47_15835, partial [Phycisphaerales bacterium]
LTMRCSGQRLSSRRLQGLRAALKVFPGKRRADCAPPLIADVRCHLNTPQTSAPASPVKWYLAHAVAIYALILITWMFAILLRYSDSRELPELTPALRIFLGPGVFAVFWIWIWMIVDYIRNRPSKHRKLWGWLLFLGTYAGGLAYFFAVWRARHRPA